MSTSIDRICELYASFAIAELKAMRNNCSEQRIRSIILEAIKGGAEKSIIQSRLDQQRFVMTRQYQHEQRQHIIDVHC